MELFSSRMGEVEGSFIREILKVTVNKEIISFAGGLPNPISFPINDIKSAACNVLNEDGEGVLQYSTTEGYYPLRKYIADRYNKKHDLGINPEDILITNGSQQALDLLGKVFLDKGDDIIIEKPGYLGAIQAFSLYEVNFNAVTLEEEGINITELENTINNTNSKILYCVPSFQNPTGLTYSEENRKNIGDIVEDKNIIVIEDDPYGELRFIGEHKTPIKKFIGDKGILLGSFSKIVSPAMRIGWICCTNKEIMKNLIVSKQGSDLHTNYFSQRVVHRYLEDNDIEGHIEKIRDLYKNQRDAMVSAVKKYFPENIKYTEPEGGMFMWVTLPKGYSSVELYEYAVKNNVVFVPGDSFYKGIKGANTFRLNYTNCDNPTIEKGIKLLVEAINSYLSDKKV